MTTGTLFSNIGYDQNAGGPPVPAATVVNTGGLITKADFTLTVTPSTGWAEAAVWWGPDNVAWPGMFGIYSAPSGGGTVTETKRFHAAALEPAVQPAANDGPQYFKAELVTISPGATATLTMTY